MNNVEIKHWSVRIPAGTIKHEPSGKTYDVAELDTTVVGYDAADAALEAARIAHREADVPRLRSLLAQSVARAEVTRHRTAADDRADGVRRLGHAG